MSRLEQQMHFIEEMDQLKKIGRQTYLSDSSRKENDAEHSWHLALMCMLLQEHANEPIDPYRTMCMVLIHDLIEIDAGDTYAYDDAGNQTKREREVKAANRIFNLLPKDQAVYMRELWEEFERAETNEAKFALALDKIQPTMLNHASNGKAWEEHEIKISQVIKRNSSTKEGSEDLWDYALEHFIEPSVKAGKLIEDRQ
ncbi:HD domain-containing protein [Anaeromicropila populeti]|uniref:HD domain-containing protein n=1 Tax=Anaeromicropila populeti TaxID=37658 RepID=UPI000B80C278|nr:HD domain-containing protein [Anaeromicropila populeti]